MLGSEENARFIRDCYIEFQQPDEWGGRSNRGDFSPPDGWTLLGCGAYRATFLGPDGYAYKVEHAYSNGYSQSNDGEASNLRRYRWKKMPKGCRLPRWTHYKLDGRGVMVMEKFDKLLRNIGYTDPHFGAYRVALSRLERALDLWDTHDQNIAVDEKNKLLVIIDLGA